MGFEDVSFLSFPEFGSLKALARELWLEDSEAGGTGDRTWGNRWVAAAATASLKVE